MSTTEPQPRRATHDAWVARFTESRGHRPTRADIAADVAAEENWSLMRQEMIEAAPQPAAGQCQHFIFRKRRFCASRVGECSSAGEAAVGAPRFCSLHNPETLSELRRASLAGQKTQLVPSAAPHTGGERAAKVARRAGRQTRGLKTNLVRAPKRMANPLSRQYQVPTPSPRWQQLYEHQKRPLFVDIGCARGRFLQAMALRDSKSAGSAASGEAGFNYCGVEIFAPLVESANTWTASQGLRNLHFIAAK